MENLRPYTSRVHSPNAPLNGVTGDHALQNVTKQNASVLAFIVLNLFIVGLFHIQTPVSCHQQGRFQSNPGEQKKATLSAAPLLSGEFSSLPCQTLLECFGQHGDDSKKITDDAIGGDLKDRSFRIFVNGNDDVRGLHTGLVLNGT